MFCIWRLLSTTTVKRFLATQIEELHLSPWNKRAMVVTWLSLFFGMHTGHKTNDSTLQTGGNWTWKRMEPFSTGIIWVCASCAPKWFHKGSRGLKSNPASSQRTQAGIEIVPSNFDAWPTWRDFYLAFWGGTRTVRSPSIFSSGMWPKHPTKVGE